MSDTDAGEFVSTNAQILHILKNATEPMDAHAIYAAGAFAYEAQCYNGLASLSKKGIIERDKPGKVFLYRLEPDAAIPDYLADELNQLATAGMPDAPPRHVGLSRSEYETLPPEEKRELRQKRSITVTTTTHVEEERSVAQSIPTFVQAPVITAAVPEVPAPEIDVTPKQTTPLRALLPPPAPALPAPATLHASRVEELLSERRRIDAELAAVRMLALLVEGRTERIVFYLNDWEEMLDCGGCFEEMQEARDMREEVRQLRAALEASSNIGATLEAAAAFLREYADVLDWGDDNGDEEARKAARDARQCLRLAAMLDGKPAA